MINHSIFNNSSQLFVYTFKKRIKKHKNRKNGKNDKIKQHQNFHHFDKLVKEVAAQWVVNENLNFKMATKKTGVYKQTKTILVWEKTAYYQHWKYRKTNLDTNYI